MKFVVVSKNSFFFVRLQIANPYLHRTDAGFSILYALKNLILDAPCIASSDYMAVKQRKLVDA